MSLLDIGTLLFALSIVPGVPALIVSIVDLYMDLKDWREDTIHDYR